VARIPVSGPSITAREIAYVTDAVTNAWYSNANIYNDRFEQAFAAHLGVKHAICLPSCTSAIHLSLMALGIGPGDEVIVPDVTWIATSAPISQVGATPVFADIDPVTWCLDPASAEAAVTSRTKAIIPVDLYGGMVDYDRLQALADAHGLAIIEDAAQAIGSEWHGKKAGTCGDIGVFSFHGSKTLTTGEGGMLVTDLDDVRERVNFLRDHGRKPGDRRIFWNTEVAHKYKMSATQAALGLAQLERIDELVSRKRQIFAWYHERLSAIPGLTLNAEPEGTCNSYWMVTVVVDPRLGLTKEALMAELLKADIDSRPYFYPLSGLPAYAHLPQAGVAPERHPHSYAISPYGINLPSGLNLDESAVGRVCEALTAILSHQRQA
jgi:perosamine synthetase